MKKNKMMRTASGLLVAVLLTTCIISGTFAKYVTENDASDTARVAKWGVVIEANSALFEGAYHADGVATVADKNTGKTWTADDKAYTSVTVHADAANTDIVAPGTKSSDNGLTFSIKGTPEVATTVTFDFSGANKDVFLAAGTYADRTTGDKPYDVFEVGTSGYYPVVFTLSGNTGSEWKILKTGKITEINDYLKAQFTTGKTFDANTNLATVIKQAGSEDVTLNGEYKITWEWKFGSTTNDKQDTLLGDLAVTPEGVWALKTSCEHEPDKHVVGCFRAMTATGDNPDYCNTVAFSMKITVAQVD